MTVNNKHNRQCIYWLTRPQQLRAANNNDNRRSYGGNADSCSLRGMCRNNDNRTDVAAGRSLA